MEEREKRAREYARRVFAGATRSLSEEGGHHFFRSHIAVADIDRIIEAAYEGDPEALWALKARARAMRSTGATAPASLWLFVWECFLGGEPKGRPGRKPYDFLTRDMIIAATVKILVEEFGFPATRGTASKDKSSTVSACQIVAEELPGGHKIGEDAVEAIWKDSPAKARMGKARKEARGP